MSYIDAGSGGHTLVILEASDHTIELDFNLEPDVISLSGAELVDEQTVLTFLHRVLVGVDNVLNRRTALGPTGIHVNVEIALGLRRHFRVVSDLESVGFDHMQIQIVVVVPRQRTS